MNANQPYLVLETGGDRRVPLTDPMTIGRAADNTLPLEEPGCSTRHASLRKEGTAWVLEDLGSTNGTWVNGERLTKPQVLKEGDRIQLGAQTLRVEGLQQGSTCSRCGREVPAKAAFCPGCGQAQPILAPGGTVVMTPPRSPSKPPAVPVMNAAPPPVPPVPPPQPPPLRLPPPLVMAPPPSLAAAPLPPFPTQPPAPIPVRKKKSGCWLMGCLIALVLVLLAGLGAWLLWSRLFGSKASPNLGRAMEFRQEARFDMPAAVTQWTTKGAKARFAELDQLLWPTADAGLGWAFFFETSVVDTGSASEDHLPVLFYNPWADVALVTVWDADGKLADGEVLAGDSLRRQGEAPYGGGRGWLTAGAYGPAAVGGLTARTLLAFEKQFRDGPWVSSSLRQTYPAWKDAASLEAARLACGLQLAQTFQDLVAFSASGDRAARTAYTEVLTQGAKGQAEELVGSTSGTTSESAEALKALPRERWAAFKVTFFADLGDKALVLAHHSELPDLFLGVVLQREGQGFIPQRLDCLSFNACYQATR